MRIVVCVRQGRDGEINPFDACAYEEALRIPNASITLLSMGVPKTEGFLKNLTRLGAEKAILLTDKAFAGADTLATSYALSLAVKSLSPDLVFCGRKTLEGDTGQVPVMMSEKLGYNFIGNAMSICCDDEKITCETRENDTITQEFPTVVTIERINNLRLPSIFSKPGEVEILNASDIGADINCCGLSGSPTRVLKTGENNYGKRKCKFISVDELDWAIQECLKKEKSKTHQAIKCSNKLDKVFAVGKETLDFAQQVSDDIVVLEKLPAEDILKCIVENKPKAVLFGSDAYGKYTAAVIAAKLDLGLCADCTSLTTDGKELFMIRPALAGTVIAEIRSLTVPALATVRTESQNDNNIFVCIGYGAKDNVNEIKNFAKKINAQLCSTRRMVDSGILPYEYQVGLTGKTISPPVYIAFGVSGAVHHIVGMQKSGTVIAINKDKNAPIFDYADYGIVTTL